MTSTKIFRETPSSPDATKKPFALSWILQLRTVMFSPRSTKIEDAEVDLAQDISRYTIIALRDKEAIRAVVDLAVAYGDVLTALDEDRGCGG